MKKFYTFLILMFVLVVGNAQIINIPDANFKAKLLAASPTQPIAYNAESTPIKIDTNNDGEIQVSEALLVWKLNVQGVFNPISNLTGIASFMNLRILFCNNNSLTSLDLGALLNLENLECLDNNLVSLNVSGLTHLQHLKCNMNQINYLDTSTLSALITLDCSQNLIPELDLASSLALGKLNFTQNAVQAIDLNLLTNLTSLDCGLNQLTTLDVTDLTLLEFLNFSSNQIPSIDLSNSLNLIDLTCENNLIETLDLSGLTHLTVLQCSNNQLSALDVSGLNNLLTLTCSLNPIATLDVSNLAQLQFLAISFTPIASIDLTNLVSLTELDSENTLLTTIDLSHSPNLYSLYADNNPLETLFIKTGSTNELADLFFAGNPNLQYICTDENKIAQFQNSITTYGYTNCHVNSYCSFNPGGDFYTIQGNNKYDENNTGCDASDINYPNLKLAFSDGTNIGSLISDGTGDYHYDVQAGTQTITPIVENPTYFTVSPATATVTFPATTSLFIQNFCITSNTVHNDLEVVLYPIGPARPGFDANYVIVYKNKGTSTQSGSVSLDFDDTIMDFVSSNPSSSSQVTNTLNWDFSNLLPYDTREIQVVLNLNSPTDTPAVNAGNGIIFTTTVTGLTDETPDDNSSFFYQLVVNSYDPNDKICTEGAVLPVNEVGKYVHYIIHFENNGTASAENIVVKDVIDTTKYDITTLIPLTGSDAFSTKISNTNQVEFIFQNINLPFDDANNDGYVAFKIKTLPTLVDGNTFTNSASIYFDYNAPIVTTPYTTLVFNPLAVADFDFQSAFLLSPVPTKNVLTITTKQTVVISSINIYNTIGQLVQVNTNPNEIIDVSGLKTGNYFIRIISDNGTASSKFIKE